MKITNKIMIAVIIILTVISKPDTHKLRQPEGKIRREILNRSKRKLVELIIND